jgi:hypothetical protein
MPGAELARNIRPDGTLGFLFDGLRVPVAFPALAVPILNQIDGLQSVAEIRAVLATRGVGAEDFARAWRETWQRMSALNRILLRPPP